MGATYRRTLVWLALLAGLLAAGILPALAQDSPHGPLTIGCEDCHKTTSWKDVGTGAQFNISAGSRHSPGRWTTCGDCHTAPTNFKVFSCVNCHAHLQQAMDSKHSGNRNYKFDSQSCYSCHPRGNG